MKKIHKKFFVKLLIILFTVFFTISISKEIYAKYIFQDEFYIANLNIDRTKPRIELLSINNSNIGYEGYANKTHTITIKIKITDNNLKSVNLDKNYVQTLINEEFVENINMKSKKIQDIQNGGIYQIELNNLEGNGKLTVNILEGAAIDNSDLQNEILQVNTNITIDNIAPKGELTENKILSGKVNAVINLSEEIRTLDGWKLSNDKLKIEKEFTNNISYELPVMDYAGNKSKINFNITQATYINITYASHNSEVGWTFGYGNYDIAGRKAVNINPKYKTEALAFNINGNIDDDFIQVNAYIHTYWGEGGMAKCTTSNLVYNHGYNPGVDLYKSMKSKDLITLKEKSYFQIGGSGMNVNYATDINGNNPIPVSSEYYYGVSGIKMKLKDYSYFSIIYQILVNGVGWISSCSDGQECMYSKDKPMSAFRIALVPKTEKQYVIDTWNKDIGTFNIKE